MGKCDENWRPYPHMIDEQSDYVEQFARMFRATGVQGSAPWWYPGGFRMVEMSDFGLIGPDGLMRPAAERYAALAEWFAAPHERPAADETVVLDADAHAGGYGHLLFGDDIYNPLYKTGRDPDAPEEKLGDALLAHRGAEAAGRHIAFVTPGMGTTSADTPLLAVGNTPYNGSNPPKYLNAEFNWAYVTGPDGERHRALPNAALRVPAGIPLTLEVSVGNLREATWLAGGAEGCVYLVSTDASGIAVRAPIARDVPYLGDAEIVGIPLGGVTARTEIALRMEAKGRMAFGEVLRIVLLPAEDAKGADT